MRLEWDRLFCDAVKYIYETQTRQPWRRHVPGLRGLPRPMLVIAWRAASSFSIRRRSASPEPCTPTRRWLSGTSAPLSISLPQGTTEPTVLPCKIAQFSPGTLICRELPPDGILERLLEARHRVHNFVVAGHYVISQTSLHRLLALSLGIIFVFGLYFALVEISERMGKGELWTLFFDSPNSADDSRRHEKITVGNGRT
jgi:hypothetical protein